MNKIKSFIEKHRIMLSVALGTIIVIAIFVVITIKVVFSASLDILVVPQQAKITIDGKVYENEKIYDGLMAKTVHVSMDGFDTKSFDLELKRDETTKIYTYLTGNDEWYIEHSDDERISTSLELINEQNGEAKLEAIQNKYPIFSVLPIVYDKYTNNYSEYTSYRIEGSFDECGNGEFCLIITDVSGGSYEKALQAIRGYGYSPEDYEIIYKDARAEEVL